MDLSVHAKEDDRIRTIFEDAEYFSKGYSYKLLPITFEAVNETIIHIEHNYCHCTPSDVQESNEGHSSTINEDVEERNYKKKKIKTLVMDNNSAATGCETEDGKSLENSSPVSKCREFMPHSKMDDDCGVSVQPLDLSLPLLQEQKTDKTLTENQSNIPKIKSDTKNSPDKKQLNLHESNKENVTSPSKKIEVTVSRPGQKGFYEPCEVFLNDLAKISPDLIKNDCHEIEIIDRTHSQDFQQEASRTYYIVSEPTWRIFESSTERIILTNDLNIGQPIQNSEKYDKPRYLIFDQYSLTESLSKICESKGGSFEYTCLEESREQSRMQDNDIQELVENCDDGNGGNRGGCSLKSDVTFDPEEGSPENKDCDTGADEEGKEKVSDDCAISLGNGNCAETTSENSDNKVEHEEEAGAEQLHSDDSSNREECPSEDPPGSSQVENENENCDRKLCTVPAKSVEPNLVLSEPIIALVEPGEPDDKLCNPGSGSTEEPTELKIELVNDGKCGSDAGSVETNSFSQSELKGTKRVRASTENSCAISEKIKKLNSSADAQDTMEAEKVQKSPEDVDEDEETEEDPSPSFLSTTSKDPQPSGERGGEAEEVGEVGEEVTKCLPKSPTDKEEPVKVVSNGDTKEKSRRTKSKIIRTDMKTRSSKEVSVLRNGKQRCAPSAKVKGSAKQERDKMGPVKISKPRFERTKEMPKTRGRGRARKSTKPEEKESRKICLRKRT